MQSRILSGKVLGLNVSKLIAAFAVALVMLAGPLWPVFAFAQEADLSAPVEAPAESTPSSSLDEPQLDLNPIQDDQLTPESESKLDPEEGSDLKEGLSDEENSNSLLDEDPGTESFGSPVELDKNRLSTKIDEVTGALVYQYKIIVPPGRNELTPDLSLVYSSSDSKNDSVVGSGWNFTIPYIERINKDGTNNLFSESYYSSSLDGELVSLGSGSYGPQVDNGSFNGYALASNVWTVTDKKGNIYKFGTNAAERQDNPSDSTKIYKWMIQEIRDVNDNYITYEYSKDAGQIYPSKITYTGNSSTEGIFTINFVKTSRSGGPTTYSTGFGVKSNYRITEVRTEISTSWVRKYTLAYTTGDSGSGSLLDTITEQGQDESSTITTLPAEDFNYKTSASTTWTYNSSWTMPLPILEDGKDFGMRMADINGDGLIDLLCHNNSTGSPGTASYYCDNANPKIYLNNGSGWTDVSSTWLFPVRQGDTSYREYFVDGNYNYSASRVDAGLRVLDVNGDGLADLVRATDHNGTMSQYVYINTGSGWTYNSSWTFPLPFIENGNKDVGLRTDDLNGDGLIDLLCYNSSYYINGSSESYFCNKANPKIYLNNGSGWTDVSSTWLFPVRQGDTSNKEFFLDGFYHSSGVVNDTGLRVLDVNGDGLADLVRATSTNGTLTQYVYINSGSGWTYNSSWSFPLPFWDQNARDGGLRTEDINGDGLVDLVCHNSSYYTGTPYSDSSFCSNTSPKIYLNNGTGWTDVSSTWLFPVRQGDTSNKEFFVTGFYHSAGVVNDTSLRILDVNGDGLADLVRSNDVNGTITQYVYLRSDEVQANLLNQITYPGGGSTSVTYKTTAQFRDGSSNLTNPTLPLIFDAVSQITNSDGLGTTDSHSYLYEGGKYYFNTYLDRKFSGFNKITTTDSAGNITINFYHQGNSTDTSNGEYSDAISKAGRTYRTEVKDSSGNLYSLSVNKWDLYSLGSGRNFVKNVRTTNLTYDGDSDHKDTTQEFVYDNANGNLTSQVNWGEVTGSADGSFTDIGSDKFTTSISYSTGSTVGVIGLPNTESTVDQSSVKVNETRHYYDTLSLGSVQKGNETKTEQWKFSTNYINTQKTYNSYGLVTQELDPRGKATNYSYDIYNLYPATVTNALSQATAYTYDYSLGKPKQVTDPNSRVFQTVYDGLDRVITEKQPDYTTPSTLVNKTAYTYTDTSGAVKVQKTDYLDGSASVDTYTYFDGLGRLIQTRQEMEDSNTFAVSDVIYNNLGKVYKESLPYSSTGTSKTTATSTASLLTTYSYDPMMRVTATVNAAGTTSNAYDDWKVAVTDARSKVKNLYKNAYGNLIKVEELNSGSTYTTLYEYNGNNNLTKITDALSNVRNFTYDGLGRRLTAQDLHASADTYYGSWTYTYDDSGNTTSVVDPKSQTIDYTYDDINRVLTENYTGVTGTEVTYAYDSGTNGIGHLTSVTKLDGVNTANVYNPVGGLSQETKTIASTNYVTSYTYDRQGNQLVVTSPDNSEIKYTYNTAGQLETVQRKESGGSYTDVVTDFDYSPHGQVTNTYYANGAITVNTYDATKLYRLSAKVTTIAGSSKAQDIAYTYDNNGNVTGITDNSATNAKKTVAYVYDDLNRLTSATATSVASGQSTYTENYAYDAIGNITSKTGPGSYAYAGNAGTNYANPHAATTIGSDTYSYDNNGNLTTVGTGGGTATIAVDATSTSITNAYTGTVTKTWSHTTGSGSNRLMVLTADLWQDVAGTGAITAASYNGVAMTKATNTRSEGMATEVWYLANPASGSNTVSVTVTGATDSIKLAASTFTGVDQTTPYVASATATGDSGNPTISRTTTQASSLLVSTLSRYSTTAATTNKTSLYNNATGSTLGASSYQVTTTTGSYSDTYTGSAAQDWSMIASEFKPASSGSGTTSLSNTWDYNNRLTQTVAGSATVSYLYDETGQRVKYANGTNTTYYPSQYYNVTGTTSTKHIITPDGTLLATVETSSSGGSSSIAADATSTSITTAYTGTVTKTWTHTTGSGSNRLMVLSADLWQDVAGTGAITSASYNGVAMTKATNTRSGGMASEVWYLANPTTGANTVSVTVTGATDNIKLAASTFTGVDQTTPLVASATATGSSGNPVISRTTTVANSLLAATLSRYSTTAATTNKTSLYNNATGSTLGAASYQITTTTGSYSDTYTGSAAQDWSMVAGEFRPASGGPSTVVHYLHTDHLTGSNVVTNSSNALEETMDYFPFGSIRVDTKAGTFSEQKKFAGTEFDVDTGLNYMQARYYKSDIGRFVSEDPMFLGIGSSGFMETAMMIVDPQRLNSYSYAGNNPIKNIDSDGLSFKSFYEEQKNKVLESLAKSVMQTFESLRQGHREASQRLSENENAQVLFNLCAVFCGIEVGLEESTAIKVGTKLADGANDISQAARGSYIVESTKVLDRSGRVIYTGKVNLQQTIEAIDSGALQPRRYANGTPKYYNNAEGHPELDYSNGNKYIEYNVINSGAPTNGSERILKGTVKNDVYYTSPHYSRSEPLFKVR